MYGHSSVNCNLPAHCLVCAEQHKTDECQRKVARNVLDHQRELGIEPDRSFVKCSNCGGNHTANYKKCIARQAFIEIQSRFNRKTRKQQKAAPPTNDERNFPSLIMQTQNQSMPRWGNGIQLEQTMTTNVSINQQMQLMTEMIKTMQVMLDKLSALIELFSRTNHNNVNQHSR